MPQNPLYKTRYAIHFVPQYLTLSDTSSLLKIPHDTKSRRRWSVSDRISEIIDNTQDLP